MPQLRSCSGQNKQEVKILMLLYPISSSRNPHQFQYVKIITRLYARYVKVNYAARPCIIWYIQPKSYKKSLFQETEKEAGLLSK